MQADCSVREAKRVLNVFAEARLFAATAGEIVAVAAGVEVRIVGTWLFGVPVTWGWSVDEGVEEEAGVVGREEGVSAEGWGFGIVVDAAVAVVEARDEGVAMAMVVDSATEVSPPGTGNGNERDDCSGVPGEAEEEAPGDTPRWGVTVRLWETIAEAEAVFPGTTDDIFLKPEVSWGGKEIVLSMGGRKTADVAAGIVWVCTVDSAGDVEGLWSTGCVVAAGDLVDELSRVTKIGVGVVPSWSCCVTGGATELLSSLSSCKCCFCETRKGEVPYIEGDRLSDEAAML